jgi:hypothetical protein
MVLINRFFFFMGDWKVGLGGQLVGAFAVFLEGKLFDFMRLFVENFEG